MAAIICASGQRRFVELFLLKLIKWTVKMFLKSVLSLSRQYVDDVRGFMSLPAMVSEIFGGQTTPSILVV